MSETYDCADAAQRSAGLSAAEAAVLRGELIVLPTDTVYGLGADAFTRRCRSPPCSRPRAGAVTCRRRCWSDTVRAASALVEDLGQYGHALIEAFWPGGLTLVCRASRTLQLGSGRYQGNGGHPDAACTRSRSICSGRPGRWR